METTLCCRRLALFLVSLLALRATASEPSGGSAAHDAPLWGVEAELLAPFVPKVHIVTLRASRSLRGADGPAPLDLLAGIYARPRVEHDIVEIIDEYHLTLGLRQHFLRIWHVEAQLDGGYAWGTNNRIDGLDHDAPALLGELHAGCRVLLPGRSRGPYLAPQVGVIHGLVTDIGPRGGKSDTFFSGKLQLGWLF